MTAQRALKLNLTVGALTLTIPFLFPEVTSAHAFGATYTLPLPSWIFLYGGAVTVALSFLLVSFFLGQKRTQGAPARVDISENWLMRLVTSRGAVLLGKMGLALWVGVILAGYLGSQDTTSNISPTMCWVVVLLGFTYLCVIFGDLWSVVSPFRTLVDVLQKLT